MSGFCRRWKKAILDADSDFLVNNIKAVLVDLTDLIGTHVRAITAASNATPIVITSASHGFTTGDVVSISGVGGNTNANGQYRITVLDANTYSLQNLVTGANIAGNAAYTSGGFAINLTTLDFLDDIASGARLATSGNLTSKTTTGGRIDFDDFTLSAVPNTGDTAEAVFLYDDTPAAESGKFIIGVDDQAANLPVTPNGGDISYAVHASGFGDI